MVACCFLAAFVLLLNFEYIDIHLVSDICVSYVHVLHLPSPPGDPSAVSDGPKDCWQKSLIVRALGLTPKGTPKLGNCTRGLKFGSRAWFLFSQTLTVFFTLPAAQWAVGLGWWMLGGKGGFVVVLHGPVCFGGVLLVGRDAAPSVFGAGP